MKLFYIGIFLCLFPGSLQAMEFNDGERAPGWSSAKQKVNNKSDHQPLRALYQNEALLQNKLFKECALKNGVEPETFLIEEQSKEIAPPLLPRSTKQATEPKRLAKIENSEQKEWPPATARPDAAYFLQKEEGNYVKTTHRNINLMDIKGQISHSQIGVSKDGKVRLYHEYINTQEPSYKSPYYILSENTISRLAINYDQVRKTTAAMPKEKGL